MNRKVIMSWLLAVLEEQTGRKKSKSKGSEARKDSAHPGNRKKGCVACIGNMGERSEMKFQV